MIKPWWVEALQAEADLDYYIVTLSQAFAGNYKETFQHTLHNMVTYKMAPQKKKSMQLSLKRT